MDQRRRDPGFDERRSRRLEPAIEHSGQVSLHGIPGPVVVQVLYGLQQRTREGSKTGVSTLRQVGWELRLMQPESVEHVAVQARREHHKLVSCFARHVRRAFLRPETERVKDVWDLVAFGLSGRLDFIKISQPWLREAAKRWAADDLPRRRGKATAGPVQHYLVSLAARPRACARPVRIAVTRRTRWDVATSKPSCTGWRSWSPMRHRLSTPLVGDWWLAFLAAGLSAFVRRCQCRSSSAPDR